MTTFYLRITKIFGGSPDFMNWASGGCPDFFLNLHTALRMDMNICMYTKDFNCNHNIYQGPWWKWKMGKDLVWQWWQWRNSHGGGGAECPDLTLFNGRFLLIYGEKRGKEKGKIEKKRMKIVIKNCKGRWKI